jgi:tetratricopeptide (TPR) repeat protein
MKVLHPLTVAIALLLGTSAIATDANAQRSRDRDRGRGEQSQPAEQYPNATRESPKPESSPRTVREMKRLQEAYDAGDKDQEVITAAEAILAHQRSTAYEKAVAQLMAGSAAMNLEDYERAITYLRNAIASNALPNSNHFNAMLILGNVYYSEDRYPEAIEVLTKLIAESGSTEASPYVLLGASYYSAEQYEQAIEPLRKAIELDPNGRGAQAMQLLMASYDATDRSGEAIALAESAVQQNPDDKRALMNLVTLYSSNDQDDKALALLDQARSKGMISTADDYRRLYGTYFNMQREAEAAAVIQEGLDKNVLPKDGATYTYLAQAHYFSDNPAGAIAAAQAGLPHAQDGQLALFLAQVLSQEDRNAESIAAARDALAKGLQKPGEAWMVIARGEFYNDNIPGARAAYQEAVKDPTTRSQAETELAKLRR